MKIDDNMTTVEVSVSLSQLHSLLYFALMKIAVSFSFSQINAEIAYFSTKRNKLDAHLHIQNNVWTTSNNFADQNDPKRLQKGKNAQKQLKYPS